jgi:prevent-host-death family protein
MCYSGRVSEVGLRELRQHASDLVRRAEAGERVTITVAGRPAAVIGPAAFSAWRHWDDIAVIFDRPSDPDWAADGSVVDQSLVDPWDR